MKWTFVALAGACFSLLLILVSGLVLVRYLDIHVILTVLNEDDADEDEEDEAYNAAVQQDSAKAAALGLDKYYTPVYLLDYARHELYKHKNFKLVEERLTAARENTATPFDRYRYSASIEFLSEQQDGEDLEALIAVADEWVAASPVSHFPPLIRGKLLLAQAWEYRGDGYANEVSATGWEMFGKLAARAKSDLLAAERLSPDDPEVAAGLADAVAPIESLQALQVYHDKTLALNPHHLHVRYTMMNYLQPQWYGTWSEFDAYLDEIQTASEAFPYLLTVRRDGLSLMEDRGPAFEGLWNAPETLREMAAAYKAQLQQNPGEPVLLGSGAYFALQANDTAMAADCFERLGRQFPVVYEYWGLHHFHQCRVRAFLDRANDPDVTGTPREKALLDALREVDPTDTSVNAMYLAYLARKKDDAETAAFWNGLDDAYLKTGEIGSPPNYDRLMGMAFAGRSDDEGKQGTEEESVLLEQAIAIAPDNAFVRLVHAEYYIRARDFDQARVHLDHARKVDPGYLPALHIMGWLNFHQKRWDDGIAAAEEFLAADPSPYVEEFTEDAREIIDLCKRKKAAAAEAA